MSCLKSGARSTSKEERSVFGGFAARVSRGGKGGGNDDGDGASRCAARHGNVGSIQEFMP